jgi:cell division septum initiation protein DivIVA
MVRADDGGDTLPPTPAFEIVMRGFDRAQVQRYLNDVENNVRLLTADRNSALSQIADLKGQLQDQQAEISEIRQSSSIEERPVTELDPEQFEGRARRVVRLAAAQATEITARAQAAAEDHWASTGEAAARLRSRYEELLGQIDLQHQQLQTEHETVINSARVHADELTTAAMQRRKSLDDEAEQRRILIEREFESQQSARRNALNKELADLESASRSKAEKRVREAAAEADRRIAEANRQVRELQTLRTRIAAQLRDAQGLVQNAAPLLKAYDDEHSVAADGGRTPAAPTARTNTVGAPSTATAPATTNTTELA